MASFNQYSTKYDFLHMTREEGILEVRFHTNGGPLVMSDALHANLQFAWQDIGSDIENQVIILTGTGDVFCTQSDAPGNFGNPNSLNLATRDAKNMYEPFFDIDAPIIAALNGPAHIHADIMVTADLVLAASHTTIQDFHIAAGMVTGGIAQVIWMELLGFVRGKYFLLTGQQLDVQQALEYGVVHEVVPSADLLPRARALARTLTQQPATTLRNTRRVLNQQLRQRFVEEAGYGYTLLSLALMDQARTLQPTA
ncbi:enoyl-CoA hydratase/isomerase family protein [Hymenobacter terrenus]|uniref:enoyl-CoA hydratase/isomerase family protein n=1 Tax=Hymenobacter terrenus TaxID=1629124 RepID=UPI000619ECB9|nr:enoyl-CoA hydratase/isomerase family protein [Hymenobacter terrenus]